uniref:CCHC-type domain-containing protein n=1 Tax=Oryza brachyantha TaxID=4533 RepID=J3N0S4_ORYBR
MNRGGVWRSEEHNVFPGNPRQPSQEFRAVVSHALGRDGGRRDSDQRGAAPKTLIKCFKCGKEEHHQANCANPPLCYACHNTGHIALNCSLHVQKRGIKLVGFGIPGQGFFSLHIDIPAAESEKIPVRGIMAIIDSFGEVDKIEKELNHMFSDVSWEWKVKQLNEREFLITFPSKMIRRQLSRTKSFDFECYPIKASVVETAMTEEAVDELMAVWVKIFGIPNFVRDEVHVKEIAELVGEFEVLDEKSIKGDGPVRVRVACKDPNELFVSMLIYINKVGYKVCWEPEGFKRKAISHPPFPPKDQKDDDDVDDLGGDDDNESFLSEKTLQDKLRKGAASAPAKTRKSLGPSHSKKVALDDRSCFSPIPMLKLEMDNISRSKESNPLAMVVWEEDEMGICTQEPQEDKMNVNVVTEERMRAEEALDEIDSFEVVSSKRTKKKKGKIPILVKRKSDRNKGQVVPVQNSLEDIASKAGLCLGTNRKEIDRNIATIKAKELAQVALAECEWKKKQCKKEVVRDIESEEVINSVIEVEKGGYINSVSRPLVVGGDFNMYKFAHEKSNGWILSENFSDLVLEKMPIRDNDYILNFWNTKLSSARKFLKGWGANKNSEWKRAKQELVSKLESFDLEANLHDLCPEQWEERYKIEKELDQQDLYEMLIMLYHGELDLKRLNYGVITLIPKCNEANSIRQFRLICVLNDCFKIISKVITNRISLIASEIISHTQTAFIPERFILEGGIVLHEVLHELKTKNLSGVIFKIDFEKAYDKVSWEFLFEVLKRKGFSDNWIGWIKSCVTGGKVCVNINGNRSQFFGTSRGLRQGDPLSPLLFNLVGDALARMFELAKSNGILSGLVPNLVNGGLTHLQYTDDTIIFIPCIDSEIMATKFLLYCFEEISGMKINYHKSEVFSVGISPEGEQRVANTLNCNSGSFPLRYLGLPMSPNRLRADAKFLLYCFEEISGMKINYHKSEVFSVGISPEGEQRVANTLNCNSVEEAVEGREGKFAGRMDSETSTRDKKSQGSKKRIWLKQEI